MIEWLAKKLIKDYRQFDNAKVRESYGMLCGIVGIVLNVILFGIKFFGGVISGSVAITADAFNNLSDAGSSVVSLLGFKIAGQKPDPQHPFGHGRVEYISGLLISIIIILMGWELLKSSVNKIIHPEETEFSVIVIVILTVSILVKIYMSLYNRTIGNKIDSASLRATSTDSISDTVATFVVLVTTLISHFFNLNIDGYCGAVVSLFVLWAGINAAKDTIGPLLGQPPKKEFVEQIENIVMAYESEGVLGIHDLIVHDYGPGRIFISLHVEVPSDRDILEMHDMIDRVEHELSQRLECGAVIHMDPVCVNDPETKELKSIVKEAVGELNKLHQGYEVTIHDFRIVKGPTHTNLIFDVVLPFKYNVEDEEVIDFLQKYVSNVNENYFCAINIDKDYA